MPEPTVGQQRFNAERGEFEYFTGTEWVSLSRILEETPVNPVKGQSYYNPIRKEYGYWNGIEWIYSIALVAPTVPGPPIIAIKENTNNLKLPLGNIFACAPVGNLSISGIVLATESLPTIVVLFNAGPGELSLLHESSLSLAANRFHFTTSTVVKLHANSSLLVFYNENDHRWHDIGASLKV